MGKRKKKKKTKLKGRARRVAEAPQWVRNYLSNGGTHGNLLRKYRAKFGIDWESSILELKALGIEFDSEYLAAVRQSAKSQNFVKTSQTPISHLEFGDSCLEDTDSDETYAYIAGYTSNGVPYGVTWEEMDEEQDWE